MLFPKKDVKYWFIFVSGRPTPTGPTRDRAESDPLEKNRKHITTEHKKKWCLI